MRRFEFTPRGICARKITFELEGDVIQDVKFMGGCPGNQSAIARLIKGKKAGEIADILEGNDCGGRGTSCADQLSKALKLGLEKIQADAVAGAEA